MFIWGFFLLEVLRMNSIEPFCRGGIHLTHQHYKRFLWMLIVVCLGILILLGRLAHIQIISTESFSSYNVNLIKKSVQQRQQQIVLHSGRGEITDREGAPLTGKSTYVLVLFPLSNKIVLDDQKMQKVADILNISKDRMMEQIKNTREPKIYHSVKGLLQMTEEEANQINALDIPGVIGLPYELRYDPAQMTAQHLIGYVGQNAEYIKKHFHEELAQGTLQENSIIGISGIEKTFQPFLQGVGPTSLSYYVDGRGQPLHGMDIKYLEHGNPFYPLVIQTTLDLKLQNKLESLFNEYKIKEGAAVVLDTETSEILAMTSRPNYIEQMNQSSAWENRALKRLTPGSIFKIVIAAAALEKEIVKEGDQFQCDGVLEGSHLHCWKEGGHGKLSFEEGFAESCNIVFGQLAEKLGPNVIEEYAEKLGLLTQNGWDEDLLFHLSDFKQLDGEDVGQVFAARREGHERHDREYLLQTGIGQLDVQVTPLAVANMIATITKGGNKHETKAVRDILYQTGGSFYHFGKQKLEGEDISPYTAYQLQKLLAGVVEKGTAKRLAERKLRAGGKTGTAQVLSKNYPFQENKMDNHKWFAGFYPKEQPRYAIVVVNMYQEENARNVSIDLFGDLVEWIDKNK